MTASTMDNLEKVFERNVKRILRYQEVMSQPIQFSLNYRRFSTLDNQWDADVQKMLKDSNVPALCQNVIAKHLDAVIGEFSRNIPDLAVNSNDIEGDPRIVPVIRHLVEEISKDSVTASVYTDVFGNMLRTGLTEGILLYSKYANDYSFQQNLYVERISFEDIIYDIYATLPTKSDGRFIGYRRFIPKDMYHELFGNIPDSSMDDRGLFPNSSRLFNLAGMHRDTLVIYQIFEREVVGEKLIYLREDGTTVDSELAEMPSDAIMTRKIPKTKIYGYVMGSTGILSVDERTKVEWPGQDFPIVGFTGIQFVDNNKLNPLPMGVRAKGLQNLKNISMSQLGSMVLNMRKETVIADKALISGADLEKYENPLRHMGVYWYDSNEGKGNPPQVLPPTQLPITMINLYLQMTQELDATLGRFDAIQGNESLMSGVKTEMEVGQNNAALFFYLNNFYVGMAQLGKVITQVIPHVYVDKRVINIDDQLVRLNSPGGVYLKDIQMDRLNIRVNGNLPFEIQKRQYARIMMQMIEQVPPELKAALFPFVLENIDFPNSAEISKIMNLYLQLKMNDWYQALKSKDPNVIQKKLEEQNAQKENMMKMLLQKKMQQEQFQQTIEQSKQDIEKQKQILAEKEQQLKTLTAMANFQLESEKIDHEQAADQMKFQEDKMRDAAELGKAWS